ncbi:MAG TPA: histidine kinase N-terminal 7TM domain-containing protein [bacterium]|nr:histidine kinase N-terminal 7TM domain-containing protein [bacterium]HPN44162.1 histidine kinase N-terminal 7TM domain-containing protein [bacterium]
MDISLYNIQFYSWALLFAGFIAFTLALLLKKFTTLSARVLRWLQLSVALWSWGMTLESAATTVPLKTFWSQVAYLGSTTAPVLFLLLAIAYSQYDKKINQRNIILLFILPILTIVMAFTNNWHHLVWTSIVINPETNIALYNHGAYFWFFIIYAYLCLLSSIILIIISFRKFPGYYKEQTIALITASLFPITGNIVYVFNINPVPGLEWTPIAFMVSGAILAYSIFKFHMFDLVPIARNNIVDSMNNGIIVFDNKDRIVDLNPAMRGFLSHQQNNWIGQSRSELPESWENAIAGLQDKPDDHYDIIVQKVGQNTYFDVQLITLRNQKQLVVGKLFLFHDISKRKNLELEREKLITELQDALAQVKNLSGLLPICANCKKIRDDQGNWHSVESYVTKHSEAKFSHGICPDCRAKLYPDYTDK